MLARRLAEADAESFRSPKGREGFIAGKTAAYVGILRAIVRRITYSGEEGFLKAATPFEKELFAQLSCIPLSLTTAARLQAVAENISLLGSQEDRLRAQELVQKALGAFHSEPLSLFDELVEEIRNFQPKGVMNAELLRYAAQQIASATDSWGVLTGADTIQGPGPAGKLTSPLFFERLARFGCGKLQADIFKALTATGEIQTFDLYAVGIAIENLTLLRPEQRKSYSVN